MPWQPVSEKESQLARCIPAGVYDFEVYSAEETTSRNGNDMIALRLRVFVDDQSILVRDWLLDGKKWAWKVRHFAESCNMLECYESGNFCGEAIVGASGRVQIAVEDSDAYGPQNRVKDYGEPKKKQRNPDAVGGQRQQKAVQSQMGLKPDDVPF